MDMIQHSALLLALAIFLAIGVERLLEIVRSIQDYSDARSSTDKWNQKAESMRDVIEQRLDAAKRGDIGYFNLQLLLVQRYLAPAPPGQKSPVAVSADQLRKDSIKLRYKIAALLLGVLLAWLFHLNVFELVKESVEQTGWFDSIVPGWMGICLTGMAMGFGSGPVHKLITALERSRDTRR